MKPTPDPARPKRLILLGSTGSIGQSTLKVVESLGKEWEIVGLGAGRNAQALAEQARRLGPVNLAIADEASAATLRTLCPQSKIYAGANAAETLVRETDADMVLAAIVGAAGLPATLQAISRGMNVALANKETLVSAGALVMPLVKRHGVQLIPVDSEHSAIFQCLQAGDGSQPQKYVKRIVLTASGGPFRKTPLAQIHRATVAEALNHPTWNMGPKITVDSASMMNKALEIIEAHWLFGLRAHQIKVIIHPQSIAHSFVEFLDHSILAQLGSPDMKTPIQYALTWPHRSPGCSKPLDWSQLRSLDFEEPDPRRFPALDLAYRAITAGGTSGAILNAANETAVEAFLAGAIPFGRIVELNAEALGAIRPEPAETLEAILKSDRQAREFVRQQMRLSPASA